MEKIFNRIFLTLFFAAIFCFEIYASGSPYNSGGGAEAAEARLKLLETADSFLGTPYRYAGIDKRGLDCSGLIYLSFREAFGQTVPRTSHEIYNWTQRIQAKELQPGDFVFFTTVGNRISHVGIYAGDGFFIHSASDGPHTGVIYSHLNESYWNRTYTASGRIFPWDSGTEAAMSDAVREGRIGRQSSGGNSGGGTDASVNTGKNQGPRSKSESWGNSGFFSGIEAAWIWGAFVEGSMFRGISASGSLGYKWQSYQAGLQFRPVWDNALGVVRLSFAFALGNENFNVFAGPAYVIGNPALKLSSGERHYFVEGKFGWEFGVSAGFIAAEINSGVFSLYGELVFQPYSREGGFHLRHDTAANFRVSTGIRYLFKL